ncbi:uncharacterized protein LOC144451621 isoform X1 [Glandiceps talaboti]
MKMPVKLILLGYMFLCFPAIVGNNPRPNPDREQRGSSSMCTPGEKCPAGFYMERKCTGTTPPVCSPCPADTYMAGPNERSSCLVHTPCDQEKEDVIRNGSATGNFECKCKREYFKSPEGSCLNMAVCEKGSGVAEPGTSTTNTVCKECESNSYSDVIDFESECKIHTNCEQFHSKTVKNGSKFEDAECDPPINSVLSTDVYSKNDTGTSTDNHEHSYLQYQITIGIIALLLCFACGVIIWCMFRYSRPACHSCLQVGNGGANQPRDTNKDQHDRNNSDSAEDNVPGNLSENGESSTAAGQETEPHDDTQNDPSPTDHQSELNDSLVGATRAVRPRSSEKSNDSDAQSAGVGSPLIDPCGNLLFKVAEDLTEDNCQKMKERLILGKKIPRGHLENVKSCHELFRIMHDRTLITEINLSELNDLLRAVGRKDLIKNKVQPYLKAKRKSK